MNKAAAIILAKTTLEEIENLGFSKELLMWFDLECFKIFKNIRESKIEKSKILSLLLEAKIICNLKLSAQCSHPADNYSDLTTKNNKKDFVRCLQEIIKD